MSISRRDRIFPCNTAGILDLSFRDPDRLRPTEDEALEEIENQGGLPIQSCRNKLQRIFKISSRQQTDTN